MAVTTRKHVKIVVLGDIGRSPRMQYHAESIAEMGHKVDIIGYGESELIPSVKNHPQVSYHYLTPVPQLPFFNYLFKPIFQAINLLFLLIITENFDIMLVQNPPAIPTLIICCLFSRILGAKFIIDWHNYAYSIMALNVGRKHKLVTATKWVEKFFGKKSDVNFCVTNAMREDLKKNWNIEANTLYDKPPMIFQPLTIEEKHKFFKKMAKTFPDLDEMSEEQEGGQIILKDNRPGILVSSTSWTQDEDFSILLEALKDYEQCCQEGNVRQLPKLLCFITGKGPMKQYYLKFLKAINWKFVKVFTPWLEPEDYPKMLGVADLGVSLHISSSGLDLPMKVVDMFGCELPVCAFNFKCLGELVRDGENGFVFEDAAQLSKQILNWFEKFPNNEEHNLLEKKIKDNLKVFIGNRWKENWQSVASGFF